MKWVNDIFRISIKRVAPLIGFTFISLNLMAESWYDPSYSAYTMDEADCRMESEDFKKKEVVSEACYERAFKMASSNQKVLNKQKTLFVVGVDSALFIREKTSKGGREVVKDRTIAGPLSELYNIQSLRLSPDNKWVAVVNKDKTNNTSILLFDCQRNGHVSPNRKISAPFLSSMTDIQFHPNNKWLVLLMNSPAAVYLISEDADSRSSEPKKAVVAKESLMGKNTQLESPTQLFLTSAGMAIVDQNNTEVLVFSLKNWQNPKPLKKYRIDPGQRVEVDSGQVVVKTSQNETVGVVVPKLVPKPEPKK